MAAKPIETTTVSVPSTKITDLNMDCLENIFKRLSFEDLFNVADANAYLKKAADLVYTVMHGHKRVFIQDAQPHISSSCLLVFTNSCNTIIIYSLKSVLQILRSFGHIISQIMLFPYCMIDVNTRGYIIDYIATYCADYLNEIQFMGTPAGILELYKNPFRNVKKVEIVGDDLTINLMNKVFPNIKHLKIIYYEKFMQNDERDAINVANIEFFFPYLDHMEIFTNHSTTRYSLRTLGLHNSVFDEVRLTTENNLIDHCRDGSLLPFNHLERICLEIPFENDDDFYGFFSKYQSITKFKLIPRSYNQHKFIENDLNVVKLSNAMPWLKQIDLSCCKFTPSGVVQWINQFNSLERFQFYFGQQSEFIDLQKRLGNEWRGISIIDGDKIVCDLIRN